MADASTPNRYAPSLITFPSIDKARDAMRALEIDDDYSVNTMAAKCMHRVIRLKAVRNAMANILKQEALALGADAAVSKYTVNCSKPTTDVLIMGTLIQLRQLASKMRFQVSEAEELADAIEQALGQDAALADKK